MKINIKLDPGAKMPTKAHEHDAGWDLYLYTVLKDQPRGIRPFESLMTYSTGVSVQIPSGYVGLVLERSSTHLKYHSLANKVGVIDSTYRGVITLKMYRQHGYWADKGDRIAQLLIIKSEQVEWQQVESLDDTERGSGGFGSSDKACCPRCKGTGEVEIYCTDGNGHVNISKVTCDKCGGV